MAIPRILIFRTAGTNCDRETEFAFQKAGAKTELSHINLIRQKQDFSSYQIICIPGGFSYGDDLGAGKVFSLEFMFWLRDSLKSFIQGGGLILGICNGFQVLVKSGILPDLDFVQKISLTHNFSGRFEARWVQLKLGSADDSLAREIWLKGLPEIIELPVAHAEGRFYCSQSILAKIKKNNQVILRYNVGNNTSLYPVNPNGSLDAVAGITDSSGRILGLMPHPERFIFSHQHPWWQKKKTLAYGFNFFQSSVDYFK